MHTRLPRRCATLASVALMLSACAADTPVEPEFDTGPAFGRGAPSAWLPFADEFDTFDGSVWTAGDHGLGRSWLSPANVAVSGGLLRLQSPAGTYDGAEIASNERVDGGTLAARMRCALPAGALCAFFLYEGVPGDRNDEIDIEIIAATRRMMMTTWVRGRQTNHAEITLEFDPATAFHTYAIDWRNGSVAFSVDGVVRQQWTRKVPSRAMKIYANAWWPVWLSGPLPATTSALEIDRITGA